MARSLLAGLTVMGLMLAPAAMLAGEGAYVTGDYYGHAGAHGVGRGGFNQFWHRCGVDFHRNNSWPEPFLSADKMAVRTPWCMQVDNGWKLHNTIGTFLFDYETQRINQAGDLLVKWIIQQAPINRRAVFVLKGDTPEATAARIESVQAAVAKYSQGSVCPVLLTDTEPPGWPAAYIDTITQQFNATIPAPRLPPRESSEDGGGGGATQ
jgi:hypothetical protein